MSLSLARLTMLSFLSLSWVLISACSPMSERQASVYHLISGEALYRERMLLPPGSRLEITVQDVSRADAPAVVLERQVIEAVSAPAWPFQFRIPSDKTRPWHRYSVSARITHEGRLMFITDLHYPVLAGEQDQELQLVMKRVSRSGNASVVSEKDQPLADLKNTYWKLVSLNGQSIKMDQERREPHMMLREDQRLQGFSGCNPFMGRFSQEGNLVTFGPVASTLMACVPDLSYDRTFMQLLQGQAEYQIEGEVLTLTNKGQNLQGVFHAVYF